MQKHILCKYFLMCLKQYNIVRKIDSMCLIGNYNNLNTQLNTYSLLLNKICCSSIEYLGDIVKVIC